MSFLTRRSLSTATAVKNSTNFSSRPSLSGFWMPFTDHDRFKKSPKMMERADGMYYYTTDGQKILDGTSGLWCVNAGHNKKRIVEAVQKQVAKLDFVPSFNLSTPLASQFAERLLQEFDSKREYTEVFFTGCGSSAVDTALKIALQYQRVRGQAQRTRIIGRERGYHGVNFGGISVGGIAANKKMYSGNLLMNMDHIAHTHSYEHTAFSRGQPDWGAHLADDLERVLNLHDPSTIAAVVVEPIAGSTGVLPPPKGYLERLAAICKKNDILLIFDEVITGFGRVGASFSTERFDITPDIITCAKGLTNAVVPCGAVITRKEIFEAFHSAAHAAPGPQIEMCHGYTYSGHPLAMAAGLATLKVYEEEGLYEKSLEMESYFEDAVHSLKDLPHVVDIRNFGMMAAVEFAPLAPNLPTMRPLDIFDRCFARGVLVRSSGPALALSPPLIVSREEIDRMVNVMQECILESAKELKSDM